MNAHTDIKSDLSRRSQIIIKNVSSSTTHKKTPSLRLSVFTSVLPRI